MTKIDAPEIEVPDGFELGKVVTDEELEEIFVFNAELHDQESVEFLNRWIEHLPDFDRESHLYLRDLDSGKIVSSLNCIPSTWSYEGIPIKNLEMGFVGTLPEYRRRGFIRILNQYFEHIMEKENYLISTIQGIPYFYRYSFGYDFLIPLNRVMTLPVSAFPELNKKSPPKFMEIKIRSVTSSDYPSLQELFEQVSRKHLLSSKRSQELWEAQERTRIFDSIPFETLVLEKETQLLGYFRIGYRKHDGLFPHGDCYELMESSISTSEAVLRTLHYVKDLAKDKDEQYFAIHSAEASNLYTIARHYEGHLWDGWKHMIRIPDVTKFLKEIKPVLERRVVGTMFERLSRSIYLNAFHACYHLQFQEGKIGKIENIGPQDIYDKGEIRTPPKGLVRLLLGTSTCEELHKMDIDFKVRRWYCPLLDTLFPKRPSYAFYYQC